MALSVQDLFRETHGHRHREEKAVGIGNIGRAVLVLFWIDILWGPTLSRLMTAMLWTALWFLVSGVAGHTIEASKPSAPLPPLVLWAWERPEDLRFVDPSRTAVAYLAGTIRLSADGVVAIPRLQPLVLPETTFVFPVVRLETSPREPPSLSEREREEVAAAILRMARPGKYGRLQLDFDARLSERGFYRTLIRDLRERMPESFLSITALASWCLADPWITDLPIDEAVPMLFRMGTGDGEVRRFLAHEGDFRLSFCRLSVGVSTDESPPIIPSESTARTRYVFHPSSWSPSAYERASAITAIKREMP